MQISTLDGHQDAVTNDHKHTSRTFGHEMWTFEHLQAFVMKVSLKLAPKSWSEFDVVVLFSNHCFSREVKADEVVDENLIVMDGRIRRILDKARYELSRAYLPQLVHDLPTQARNLSITQCFSRPEKQTATLG